MKQQLDKEAIPSYIVFIIALTMLFVSAAKAFSQEVKREGNNFTKEITVQSSSDVQTVYTFTVKDVAYPIYITKNGRCYILRTSKKTGKPYKQYLNKDICLQICQELGIEYKENL